MLPVHVRDRLVERLAAIPALVPLPDHPDSDLPPVDREAPEHGLLRSVQDDPVEATRGRGGFDRYGEIILGGSFGSLFNGEAGQIQHREKPTVGKSRHVPRLLANNPKLLAFQRYQWIDFGCAARRHIGCNDGNHSEQKRNDTENGRIVYGRFEYHTLKNTGGGKCSKHA